MCFSFYTVDAAVDTLNSNQLEIDEMIKEFKSRRDLMVSMLNEISVFHVFLPKGLFMFLQMYLKQNMNDTEFCDFILDNAGVAACPGSCF